MKEEDKEEKSYLLINCIINSRLDLIEKSQEQNKFLKNSKTDDAKETMMLGEFTKAYKDSKIKYKDHVYE